jgi:hypothetical protein
MIKIFDEKMNNMMKNGKMVETPYEKLWINPCYLVPKVNGGQKLVMYMTKVNKFMKQIPFKMEGMLTLLNLLTKNDYTISFDLKDAQRVFTMIMRVCVHIVREVWNMRAEVYLDDPLLLLQDPVHLQNIGKEVSQFLQ